MEKHPNRNIDDYNDIDVDVFRHQSVDNDEETAEKQNSYHHPACTHARTEQFVVKMILVRKEWILLVDHAAENYAYNIKYWYNECAENNNHCVIYVIRAPCHVLTHVNRQKTED